MSREFRPGRPSTSPRHSGAALRGAAPEDSVTVRPGDSLWSIAADFAGPAASDWQVAQAWPRWYAINQPLIGADPSQLKPGTVLRIPDTTR